MKTLPLAIVACLLAPVEAFAATPFDGEWYYVCLAPADMEATRPMIIGDDTIMGEESECDITKVTPIGTRDRAWQVTAACAGEGERWTTNAIYGLEHDSNDKVVQLIEIDMDEGWVQTYRTCN